MADHKLMPKHGEQFSLRESDAHAKMTHVCKLQQDASLELRDLIAMGVTNGKIVAFPCRQCVLDIALQFHDLSEAIKDLVSKVERKKDRCGND